MGKHTWNSKQAWLDWLSDDPPAPSAQAELRERFKQQANSYTPVNRAQPPRQPQQPVQTQPAATPQTHVVAPQPAVQPQAVSNTTPASKVAPGASTTAAPATVSIQIHIPAFNSERFKKFSARIKQGRATALGWFQLAKAWLVEQFSAHKTRAIGIAVGVAVLVFGLFIPPLFNFGYGKPKTTEGAAAGSSAGATAVKYDKPPFEVVRPSNKPKLGTPDGVHAAYDGTKNSYSYSDSIGSSGFTVSQQPLPPQFKDGQTAVESIAPTLIKGVTPIELKVLTGSAYLANNPKYNSQVLVVSVRDMLLFIQSSHPFKNSEWQDYLNTLQ